MFLRRRHSLRARRLRTPLLAAALLGLLAALAAVPAGAAPGTGSWKREPLVQPIDPQHCATRTT
ncbi:hypothetical protein [Streptomyces roseoverticillatus]|uniref:hypothetical protein n=1 Tax=Streptomyces roseoverticillatus TaxID=66429 RepID=UPI001F393FBC|nr:hypothetical protein [Streptomyces roseoverticillatus]